MQQLTIILLQLLAVALSGVLSALLRAPLPLLQIALGAALSFFIGSGAVPDPTLFLLLFIAPLLYLDAFHFPLAAFFRLRTPILMAAVGLVLFTVVGTGYFIHWLIPSIPLAISFAIASVLSPTDAVAVAGSLGGVKLPAWLMHILEGEAMLNDASGLVCFRFAVAAATSGHFSLGQAFGTFLLVASGGVFVGTAFVICIAPARQWMERALGSQPSALILIHLLLPFAAFMTAEHFKVSGVLAAVAAGFAMRWANKDKPSVELRISGEAVADTFQFTFNGLVFLLLGLQLPEIARNIPTVAQQQGFHSLWTIGLLVTEIVGALMLLRFLWIWTNSVLSQRRRRDAPIAMGRVRAVVGLTLAGVRGAVTLAAVLSLPLTLDNGAPLPGRELAIILSAGTILIWLTVASIALPWVVKGIEGENETTAGVRERKARRRMIEAAIQRIEEIKTEPPDGMSTHLTAEVADRLVNEYRGRLQSNDPILAEDLTMSLLLAAEKHFHLEAIRAQRKELHQLAGLGEIERHSITRLLRSLDSAEAALKSY